MQFDDISLNELHDAQGLIAQNKLTLRIFLRSRDVLSWLYILHFDDTSDVIELLVLSRQFKIINKDMLKITTDNYFLLIFETCEVHII